MNKCDNVKTYQKFEKNVTTNGAHIKYIMLYILEQNRATKRFNCTIIQMIIVMILLNRFFISQKPMLKIKPKRFHSKNIRMKMLIIQ